jgi:hypothetical protein
MNKLVLAVAGGSFCLVGIAFAVPHPPETDVVKYNPYVPERISHVVALRPWWRPPEKIVSRTVVVAEPDLQRTRAIKVIDPGRIKLAR